MKQRANLFKQGNIKKFTKYKIASSPIDEQTQISANHRRLRFILASDSM